MSIISLAAEMYVLRRVTEETGGTYAVALDARHLADLLMAQVAPPPTTVTTVRRGYGFGVDRVGGAPLGLLDATLNNVYVHRKHNKQNQPNQGPLYMDMVLMGFPSRVHGETPTLAFDGANPPRPTKVGLVGGCRLMFYWWGGGLFIHVVCRQDAPGAVLLFSKAVPSIPKK